ncbi:MAG: YfhO family protein, partial [Dehalococcoidia bacterium]|nr:YfhO family protein [Dehalococcoidia bacterium]
MAREGYYQGHDGVAHLFRVAALTEDLRRGLIYPRWSPDLALGYGYPVFHFYGPASHYMAWAIHQWGASLPDAVKLTYAAALAMAAIGMALFVRAALPTVGGAGAIVAAGMYALAPYVIADVYTRGAFGEAVSLATYPFLLWGVRRVVVSGGWSGVVVASVAAALAVVTYNPLALVGLPLVGLYAVWLTPRDAWAVARAVATLTLGLALSAWFWLPALVDSSVVTIGNLGYARENFLALTHLIQPSLEYRHEQFPFAIGLAQAIVVTIGAVGATQLPRPERREALFFLVMAVAVAIAITTPAAPWWEMIPLLPLLAYPWRLLAFVALFGAVVAASVVAIAPARGRSVLRGALAIVTLALVVWSSLSETLPEPIPAEARDVTPATWLRREATTGVIGTTTGAEYLPKWSAAGPGAAATTPRGSDAPTIHAARLEAVRGLDLTLVVTTTAPTDLRLHSFAFPGWTATVDGQSASVTPTTPLGLVTVAVPPGEHRVTLSFSPTAVVQVGGLITVVGAMIVVTLLAASRRDRIALGTLAALAMSTVATSSSSPPSSVIAPVGAEAIPGLILLGATLDPRPDDLALRLYWLPTRPLDRDLPLTVELVNEQDTVVARRVGPPRYGVELLTDWRANEITVDAVWLRVPTPRAAG